VSAGSWIGGALTNGRVPSSIAATASWIATIVMAWR
jgi:hypothetical protein